MEQQALCDLKRLGVLVTRPAHQAEQLCDLIRTCNGRPLSFPAIEIVDPEDTRPVRELLQRLANYRIAIFISPNAVMRCLSLLGERTLPKGLILAAVGRGTADTLARQGYAVSIVPEESFDSEALLASPELQDVAGQSILIVRGAGGRALLGETLSDRGAQVSYAEVYRRRRPVSDSQPLIERWTADVNLVTVTSQEILENLWIMLGEQGQARLVDTPLLVVSERTRARARELGIRQVLLAPRAEDRAMVQTLCGWVSRSPV